MRFTRSRTGFLAGAGVLAVLAASGPGFAGVSLAARTSAASKPGWHVVEISPTKGSDLIGVTAPSAGSAWAVGETGLTRASVFGDALVLRWNRGHWRPADVLAGVKAVDNIQVASSAPSNVWLVAQTNSFTSGGSQYLKRWNGSSWKSEPLPADDLSQLVVISPADVWGRGSTGCIRKACQTVIWHWNGKTWLKTSIPGMMTEIFGAAHDVLWADGTGPADVYHWTGRAWSAVKSLPKPPSFVPGFGCAVSADDVWISGTGQASGQPVKFELKHWNGRTWNSIAVPDSIAAGGVSQLVPNGTGGVWYNADAYWTGTRWVSTTPGPSFAAGHGQVSISRVARIEGSAELWGVGSVNATGKRQNEKFLIASYGPGRLSPAA
jgi:hypothetical protein